MTSVDQSGIVVTDIPARLDRLPWSRFHTLVVVALGITWILDGLEVTLAGSIAGALRSSAVLRFAPADVGFANSAYLAGAVLGAVLFGQLTDRLGRKRLFSITLIVYLVATACTAFAWDLRSFAIARFFTGAGIGGEYSAINSAIQEFIPARYRGRTDLAINGSFWVGAAVAGAGSILLLDPAIVNPELGWRLAFLIGAGLGLFILLLRGFLPESPRWLMIHGRAEEGEKIISEIEAEIFRHKGPVNVAFERIRIQSRNKTPIGEVFNVLFRIHPRRTVLGLSLMIAQSFFYNAIFFTYAMMLTDFYGVPAASVGWYILPFALGNVAGPLLLGPLFDTIGRKPMIIFTYAISGLLLLISGILFLQGHLTATSQTVLWSITFFFASAAASSSYLTVSESFPIEVRALAIALFYAFGTGLGGVAAPWVFGALIASGSRDQVFLGYAFGAALMGIAAVITHHLGIRSERQPLESVARPLSWREDDT